MPEGKFVVWFNEVGKGDISSVGGKGANLGELTQAHIPVPPGFIVTAQAYFHFFEKQGLTEYIHQLLDPLDPAHSQALRKTAELIK